jgi:maltose/moltooligosaccharide transporter
MEHSHLTKGILFLIVSVLFSIVIYHYDLKKDLYVLSLGLLGGLAMLVSGIMQKNIQLTMDL